VIGLIKVARLVVLAHKATISVVVDDEQNIAELALAARTAGVTLKVFVEVDVGQGRCGVPPGPRAAELAHQVLQSEGLSFAGLQGYHGAIQQAIGFSERKAAVLAAMSRLETSLKDFRRAGLQVPVITGGGTGTFPIDVELGLLTELQPGSYITMDANYAKVKWTADSGPTPLGCPLSILASVVSRPSRQRAILDVGWKSASSDGGLPQVKDRPELRFEFAGDEHGALTSATGELELLPGDRIELIASHCDTTVNLYDSFVIHRGGRPQESWPIAARGKSQ
jgi:3-hydroxy-D-aspartate aldolase